MKDTENDDVFSFANSSYVDELFLSYKNNPTSVDATWRAYFEGFHKGFAGAAKIAENVPGFNEVLNTLAHANENKISVQLINKDTTELVHSVDKTFEFNVAKMVKAYKKFGHLKAKVNPLFDVSEKAKGIIDLNYFDLTSADLERTTYAGILIGHSSPCLLKELVEKLEFIFCGSVGAELDHILCHNETAWLYQEFYASRAKRPEQNTQKSIYLELAKADALEKTIATKYIGKKRFSIEGSDSQIVACESFIDESCRLGVEEVTVAIAHRGRLNFLVNVIGKPLERLLAEWEGYPHEDLQGDCDVKYHYGYESIRKSRNGQEFRVSLPFNPSHLEYVTPVVMGDTRARQAVYHDSDTSKVASIVFHGDAAVAGQGIVFETVQMMSLRGYSVGGTVHVVANNQVGFTTNPKDSRSSTYCTDVAKVTNSPVFHVNCDDLEALHNIMELAARYREKFKKDIYIDILCFRRYGHNEADEPTFTQPLLYKIIKDKLAPYETYAKQLVEKNVFSEQELKNIYNDFRKEMNDTFDKVKSEHKKIEQFQALRDASKLTRALESDVLKTTTQSVTIQKLKELSEKITAVPSDFHVNAKLARIIIQDRKDMVEGAKRLDWGMAELLAYASLLDEGFSLRLIGEDVQRGTFSHRHATLIDAENGAEYTSLKNVNEKCKVEVENSLLSEEAAMGYEYGYSVVASNTLVIWEAQFGDFANGAQVIIDQFLAAGETKWRQQQSLVLLLPHGMEGQGAEHSSARLERFLQLCAQGNMQVCYLTSACQIFHALRRQMLRTFRKPLVIMSPKSFLRSPRASTTLEEISASQFEEILDDKRIQNPDQVKRILFCTGKIALDLFDTLEKEENKNYTESIAVIRIEQIYPLHMEKLIQVLSRYSSVETFAWVQEEPANMGAYLHLRFDLSLLISKIFSGKELCYFGRSRRATPAVGLEKLHFIEQEKILHAALVSNYSVEI